MHGGKPQWCSADHVSGTTVEAAQLVGVDVASDEAQQHRVDSGKIDVIDVGQDVLGRGWRTDDDPQTSQEQGEVTGKCLEDNRQDDVSTKAFSEYCQAEAYAPSFDPRD